MEKTASTNASYYTDEKTERLLERLVAYYEQESCWKISKSSIIRHLIQKEARSVGLVEMELNDEPEPAGA